MGTFQQFWKQPQRLWLRRALFQIHLWTGIGAGLYVFVISVSGSVVVFKNEVYRENNSPVIIVAGVGERMDADQIGKAAEKLYPGYELTQLYEYDDNPKRAVEVRLEKGSRAHNRLIDPFTGADLGRSVPWQIEVMSWFEDLHFNLFGGKTGRQINAAGGVLWTLLGLTGMVVWWQGIQNWKRGLLVRLKSGWKRINWDLHSSLGFWTLLLTLMWGVTGVFAAIPDPFRAAVDYVEPLRPNRPRFERRIGDQILRGAYALHFGNFAGRKLKIAWVILGLVPALLSLTGFLMWINRVIRKKNLAADFADFAD
jgi:uncharacterized iron-regulated membrane protein